MHDRNWEQNKKFTNFVKTMFDLVMSLFHNQLTTSFCLGDRW